MLPNDLATYLDVVFKLGEIGSIVVGIGLALRQMGRTSARVEATLVMQSASMNELKEDVKKLNEIVTKVALQGQRLDQMSERLNTLDRRMDEMRRGEGWITESRRNVEGQYGT